MSPELVVVMVGLVLGYGAHRTGRFTEGASDTLNRFVIDVCVPATILRLVPTLRLEPSLAVLVVVPWVAFGLALVFGRLLARPLGLSRNEREALILCAGLGNTSFLGFPMIQGLLGERAVSLAAVYDQLGSFLLLCIVTPVLVASASGGPRPSARALATRVATFPPFIALVLALLPLPHPRWLDDALLIFSRALVPVAMFAVGLKLRLTPPRRAHVFGVGLFVKMALMPGIAWLALGALGTRTEILRVAVLETAMPTMISAGAIAMGAGLAPELVAAWVGWGIVLAQLTIPLWARVVG
jgi:malate permease and related proteins